jgi:hypothetical protein
VARQSLLQYLEEKESTTPTRAFYVLTKTKHSLHPLPLHPDNPHLRHVNHQFLDMGGTRTEEVQEATGVTKRSSNVRQSTQTYVLSPPAHCCIDWGEETTCGRKNHGCMPEFASKSLEGFQWN